MNEKTNTMRALKDEPLLVTSFLCRFNWHNWTRWWDGGASNDYSKFKRVSIRTCAHCAKVDMITVEPKDQ